MAQKFEYDLWTATWGHGESTKAIKKELNKYGAAGWELVGMTRDESPDGRTRRRSRDVRLQASEEEVSAAQ